MDSKDIFDTQKLSLLADQILGIAQGISKSVNQSIEKIKSDPTNNEKFKAFDIAGLGKQLQDAQKQMDDILEARNNMAKPK